MFDVNSISLLSVRNKFFREVLKSKKSLDKLNKFELKRYTLSIKIKDFINLMKNLVDGFLTHEKMGQTKTRFVNDELVRI